MGSIISFFKKTGHIITHAPLLTGIVLISVVLTCITIVQVGPSKIPNTWISTPVFGLMLDPDYPNIGADNTEYAEGLEDTEDYYDPVEDDPGDTYETASSDSNSNVTTDETETDVTVTDTEPADDPSSGDDTDPSVSTTEPDKDKDDTESGDNTEKEGLVIEGVTVYETYKPRKSKSDCYVDTGLIPLTTEYAYFTAEDYSYFDDAIFIGDSRTVGLQYYSDLPDHADFVCQTGLSINKALTTECAKDHNNGRTTTGEKLLKKNTYGKVYLCIGINDIGTGNTDYIAGIYKNLLDKIRSYQPDATIFLQSIMPVTKAKSKSDNIINNENINAKNAAIARFADGEQVFYLNINEFFTDKTYTEHSGALLAEQSTDGVHIQAVYYRQWADLLLNYGIETQTE